jgi:hypothetical protein
VPFVYIRNLRFVVEHRLYFRTGAGWQQETAMRGTRASVGIAVTTFPNNRYTVYTFGEIIIQIVSQGL